MRAKHVMYDTVKAVNLAVCYMWELLGMNPEFSPQGKMHFYCISTRDDRWSLSLLW